jgi:hypothetical protein
MSVFLIDGSVHETAAVTMRRACLPDLALAVWRIV